MKMNKNLNNTIRSLFCYTVHWADEVIPSDILHTSYMDRYKLQINYTGNN
mgnify:CR=1 FL=1